MNPEHAVRLINEVTPTTGVTAFMPGMFIRSMVQNRDHIIVWVGGEVPNYDHQYAPEYRGRIWTDHDESVYVGDLNTPTELYRRVLDVVIAKLVHEAREAFRVGTQYISPFHPHREEGRKNFENGHYTYSVR